METLAFLEALFSIVLVNIILSGDNAVVIAMAARRLPEKQQRTAFIWGSAGAVVLLTAMAVIAAYLLQIPYIHSIGGLLLVWIAVDLLTEEKEEEALAASPSYLAAIKTIIIADLIMSLDNTLAIAALAKGSLLLLALGLAISVPVIIFGSKLIIKIMERLPFIIYAGAGLIAWTGGDMILDDSRIGPLILQYTNEWVVPLLAIAVVMAVACWRKRHPRLVAKNSEVSQASSGPAMDEQTPS